MTIRTAIIGASFAKAAYLPALATVDDVEVVAIASARKDSAKATAKAFNVPNAYDDWREMLEKHPVDLVGIATPTIHHAPMALAALNAGAHVICEKPMAMNSDEARQMLEKAESLGRVHLIGHELRFNPNRRKIHNMIAAGELGQIRHANIVNVTPSWGDPSSRVKDDWWSLEEMGGGRLGANGSHQIDLLRFWLGEFGALTGQMKVMVPNREDKETGEPWRATADDQFSFTAEMQSGAIVSVFVSSAARHNIGNHVQIFGSGGTIALSDGVEKLYFSRPGEEYQDLSESDPNASLANIGKGIWNVSFVGLIQEATSAIREGRKPQQGATFADGLKCQQVMDAVRMSNQERRWIAVSD